ncbi:hypothetical protein ACO0RG_004514 [Hanseniaspora osmophila]
MSYRAFFKVVFTGAEIVGKAFSEAYKQTAAQSAKGAASGAKAGGAAKEIGGITVSESCQILNLQKADINNLDKINKQYEYLFNVNDVEKGGSFYLQSKIYRAAERLKHDIKQAQDELQVAEDEAAGKKPATSTSSHPEAAAGPHP